MSTKVLIITYYWPPGSGAGVQRWLKFSKYLPSFGWDPVVLTIDPEFAAYPVTDNSLLDEISKDLTVYKTKAKDYFRIYKKDKTKIPSAGFATNDEKRFGSKIFRFIRGNFFIPDPRKGWNKYAFLKACEIIENEEIRYIITTSPPHSTQLVGLKLRKKYPGIKWVADLRDPWTNIYYYSQFYPTFFSKIIDSNFEKQALKYSDRIITVGKSLKDHFSEKIPGIENKIEVITNGFDEDDFAGLSSSAPEKFTISYIGTLSDAYPVNGILKAFNELQKEGFDYIFRFVGAVAPKQKDLILSKLNEKDVEFISYVDHASSIKFMLQSTVLLLIIPDHKSNKCIITGKLFEYIATGKQIICLGPDDGDAAGIINQTGLGKTFTYRDSPGIYNFVKNISSNEISEKKLQDSGFSRKNLTSKIASILKDLN